MAASVLSPGEMLLISEFLSSSESSDDEFDILFSNDEEKKNPRIKNFVSRVVDNWDDDNFREHFRLTRNTCQHLTLLYTNSEFYNKARYGGREQKSAKEEILMFLWFSGNKTILRSVGMLFDATESCVHRIIKSVTSFLVHISATIITFPATEEERERNAAEFRNICPIDGIVGVIDGSYIAIRTPEHKIRHTYVNRHDETAITLQGICDANGRFIDCFTGVSSKMRDSRVYSLSFIKDKVLAMGDYFHIIGDAAYPISVNLLTPYSGNLNPMQNKFNKYFCSARVKIENAFGILKNRFRQLMRLEMWTVFTMSNFIIACCVLHNLCIDRNDIFNYYNVEEINVRPNEPLVQDKNRQRRLGQMKRDRIAEDLPPL